MDTLTLKTCTVKIRTASNADGAAVRQLVYEVLNEYGLASEPEDTDACLNDIERTYLKPGGVFEVVTNEAGKLLACYGLLPQKVAGVADLRKMYARPAVRGQGLGKALMHRALKKAKLHGFCRLELETAQPLVEAIGLYEYFGFKPIERQSLPARCDRAMALEL